MSFLTEQYFKSLEEFSVANVFSWVYLRSSSPRKFKGLKYSMLNELMLKLALWGLLFLFIFLTATISINQILKQIKKKLKTNDEKEIFINKKH